MGRVVAACGDECACSWGLGLSEGMSVELGFVAAVRVFGLVLLGAGSFFIFLFSLRFSSLLFFYTSDPRDILGLPRRERV